MYSKVENPAFPPGCKPFPPGWKPGQSLIPPPGVGENWLSRQYWAGRSERTSIGIFCQRFNYKFLSENMIYFSRIVNGGLLLTKLPPVKLIRLIAIMISAVSAVNYKRSFIRLFLFVRILPPKSAC